jgi:2-octaprenyl-6-methoxyphenol hydroxylase
MRFDLIVIGGGLVGAGLVTALRHAGLRVALVDARLPNNDDPRLFALNEGSCQFLKNLGLWSHLASHATPIHQVHVSYQGHFGAVRLHHNDVHLPSLGSVIPARFIEAALNEALASLPHFTLYRPATLKTLKQQENEVILTLETEAGEKIIRAPIVIGADGTNSTVREQLPTITTETFDYKQSALVTKIELRRSHHHIAYERFTTHGAIAMLPLPENECATIWTADNEMITQLMAASDDVFLQTLQKEFGYRLGRLQKITKRHVFPLRMIRAEKSVEQGVFLLGNSAHTLHPIAAQGFNLALYEVAVLVEGLMEKIASHDAFSAADLQQIVTQTQKQQATSMGVSHRLARLFSSHSPFVSVALQLGMIGLDIASPVKKKFIEEVMGRRGRVPRLLLSVNER